MVIGRFPMGTSFTTLFSNIKLSFAMRHSSLGGATLSYPSHDATRKTNPWTHPVGGLRSRLRYPSHLVHSPEQPTFVPPTADRFLLGGSRRFPVQSPSASIHQNRTAEHLAASAQLRQPPRPPRDWPRARAKARSAFHFPQLAEESKFLVAPVPPRANDHSSVAASCPC